MHGGSQKQMETNRAGGRNEDITAPAHEKHQDRVTTDIDVTDNENALLMVKKLLKCVSNDYNDNEHTDKTRIDDSSQVINDKKLSPTKQKKISSSYSKRLESFNDPMLYFAKPISISPLVASRFGWTNTSKDMLECDKCHATIKVFFNPSLSTKSINSLCSSYIHRLATNHKSDCPFRLDAERYLLLASSKVVSSSSSSSPLQNSSNNTNDDVTINLIEKTKENRNDVSQCIFLVPSWFESVLSQETVKLLENLYPRCTIQNQTLQLLNSVSTLLDKTNSNKWNMPNNVIIPTKVQSFINELPQKGGNDGTNEKNTNNDEAENNESKRNNAQRCRIITALQQNKNNEICTHDYDSAAILTLFGWASPSIITSFQDQHHPTIELKCSICLGRLRVTLEKKKLSNKKSQEDGEKTEQDIDNAKTTRSLSSSPPAAKKQRTSINIDDLIKKYKSRDVIDPLSSHRYYCPYVCGFPLFTSSSPSTTTTATTQPAWKIIISNLLNESESSFFNNNNNIAGENDTNADTGEEKLETVRRILKAGIL